MKPARLERGSVAPKSIWKRLGWLVAIWAVSVGALALIAFAVRLFMKLAGLSL